jgi:Ser/Thr protein kinase RdoA (MazF antagonist)
MITETDEVAGRLDYASRRFPELAGRRKDLLVRLTELGEQALRDSEPDAATRRAAAKRAILDITAAMTEGEAEAMLEAREAMWSHDVDWWEQG